MKAWPGRAGLAATGASIGCFLVLAGLGPSAVEPVLAGSGPPFSLHAGPGAAVVIALMAAGVVLGAAGLGLCLWAVRRGWRCAPRPLLIAGLLATAAFALLPPVGSSDHLNYAAYGRMVVTGHDPYTTTASRLPGDPIADAVPEWRDTKSVYGPLITVQQGFASWAGGTSVRLTVFVLSVTNALAFALVGLILYRTGDPERRLRSVLLWTLNPLLLFHLVSGAHNDAIGILTAVGALAAFAGPVRRTFASGLLTGAGVAIKFPAALVGGGPAWVLIHSLWTTRGREPLVRLAALFGGAGIVTLVAYALAGSHAFDQVRNASKSVSLASVWHLFAGFGGGLLFTVSRSTVQFAALVLLAVLVWLLIRALPYDPYSSKEISDSRRIAAALVLAWLFSALYILPWYDGLGWAVLALLAWSRFDWVLLAHTTALSLAYLPARRADVIGLPGNLRWLERTMRPEIMPWVLTGVLLALVWLCLTDRRPVPGPVPTPQGPAEPPR